MNTVAAVGRGKCAHDPRHYRPRTQGNHGLRLVPLPDRRRQRHRLAPVPPRLPPCAAHARTDLLRARRPSRDSRPSGPRAPLPAREGGRHRSGSYGDCGMKPSFPVATSLSHNGAPSSKTNPRNAFAKPIVMSAKSSRWISTLSSKTIVPS